jgi:asparagine synthase (glutamine-hydrolysing)
MDRPKMGFSIPVKKWLRNELREKVYSVADYDFLETQGIFNPKEMRNFIDYFMENGNQPGRSYASRVWAFYIFQMWYKGYAM